MTLAIGLDQKVSLSMDVRYCLSTLQLYKYEDDFLNTKIDYLQHN